MSKFPPELFLEILAYLPVKSDLLSFRSTSKQIGSLATRSAFRKISVDFYAENALGFTALQSNDLAKHVEMVEFVGKSGPNVIFLLQEEDEFDDSQDSINSDFSSWEILEDCIKATTNALCLAFSGLDNFPALKELKLDFLPNYLEKTWGDGIPAEYRGRIGPSSSHQFQRQFLATITKTSLSLNKLSLLNLLPCFCPDLYFEPFFHAFICIPQHLEISVIWKENIDPQYREWMIDDIVYGDRLTHFWKTNILGNVLEQNQQLQSLNLTSPELVRLSWDNITFPHLTDLSLTMMRLGCKGTAEDFILRHKSTLRRLQLTKCGIYHTPADPPPRFWSDVWEGLAEEMNQLVCLTADKGLYATDRDDDWNREFVTHLGEYLHLCGTPFMTSGVIRSDREGLKLFEDVVSQRKRNSLK
ncbi:hypothetical protein C8J56DRAFT_936078 [Mycena floridula]|nr:hypothetical protein C8J56DRAFT_936078 [Mycena floridula]